MHNAGYIHQDVKPDNFMIKLRDEHRVRILDMGLVMEFMRDGGHKALGRYGFQGTPRFGSMSGLDGYTLSRRDDLESMGYSIMHLIDKEDIPWKDMESRKDILEAKRVFAQSPQCLLKYRGIRDFILQVSNVKYEDEPDYDHFDSVLVNMMKPYRDAVQAIVVKDLARKHSQRMSAIIFVKMNQLVESAVAEERYK